jgi:hypothetical protein
MVTRILTVSDSLINSAEFFSSVPYFFVYSNTHIVLIYTEYHSVCPLVGIGTPPTPLQQASVPYPLNQRVGGHTRLRVGGGVPIPTTGKKLSTLAIRHRSFSMYEYV